VRASQLLRGDPTSAPGTNDDARAEDDAAPTTRHASFLACAQCGQRVTVPSARVEVGGAHLHTFTNPHGLRFHIGCFASVAGCVVEGEPTTYWTWFPGYAWQVENCGSCREHLGWRFESAADVFHGLVLDRLIEVDES